MERGGTRWNGEKPAGTGRDQMERRGTSYGTEGHKMERIETIWNGEGLDRKERNKMERSGTR